MKYAAFLVLIIFTACSTGKQVTIPDGAYRVSGMNTSNTFKTKGKSLSFGPFEVSRAKYKMRQTTTVQWPGFQSSKSKIGYTFSAKNSRQEVQVKVSEKTRLQAIDFSPAWQVLGIPLDGSQVYLGYITGEKTNWEYYIRDEDLFKTQEENTAGYIISGHKAIKITLARNKVFFYYQNNKVGELRTPFNRGFSVWLAEDLDEDAQLAISAVCGGILLKIKDNR